MGVVRFCLPKTGVWARGVARRPYSGVRNDRALWLESPRGVPEHWQGAGRNGKPHRSTGAPKCEPEKLYWRSPSLRLVTLYLNPARLLSRLHRALFALLPPTRALANPVTMPTDVCMSNCCERTARRLATETFKRVGQRACLITHAPRSGCNERDALLIYDPAGARCILTV